MLSTMTHQYVKLLWTNKALRISSLLGIMLALSYVLPVLEPFRHSVMDYLKMIWWAVALGLLAGGMIDHYVPDSYVSHVLARRRKRTVLYSVLLGFLLSACSHGILALGMQLYKKGASTSSVVGFLMASPWANLPLTILLFGFFGAGAFFIVGAALLVGMTTGLIYQVLEWKGWVEGPAVNPQIDENFSIMEDAKKRFVHAEWSIARFRKDARSILAGAVSLSNMVLWWILIGVIAAGLAGAYVPQTFMQEYLGPSLLGLFLTLVLATVIEVCSEGSAPMAFELYRQTGALGNSFTFLMAGVATDYTEIGLIWSNIGRRAALWLPVVTVPQVLLLAWIANQFGAP